MLSECKVLYESDFPESYLCKADNGFFCSCIEYSKDLQHYWNTFLFLLQVQGPECLRILRDILLLNTHRKNAVHLQY